MIAEIFERRTPVIGGADGVSLVLQDLTQRINGVGIVVHDEDCGLGGIEGNASHKIKRPDAFPRTASSLRLEQ